MRAFLVAFLCGCGAASTPSSPVTKAALAGPRCHGDACSCRSRDASDAEEPAAGKRRYEIRVEPNPGVAWVSVDDNQLYAPEAQTACFYLDLAPGEHAVRVRSAAAQDPGVAGAVVSIAEHNPKGPWWYEVFSYSCGNPGPCNLERLKAWKQDVVGDRRTFTDPCSGTRIAGLNYNLGHMPGNEAAREVDVTFQLHVKPKSLDLPPRSEECPDK